MKISKNITEAKKTELKYHVINSNEVHSFSTKKEALSDLEDAKWAEKKNGTGFTPKIISK